MVGLHKITRFLPESVTAGLVGLKEMGERVIGVTVRRRYGFPYVEVRRRFLTVLMDLHNRCNLTCTMCFLSVEEFRKRPAEVLSPEVLKRLRYEVWPRTEELWLSCSYEPLIAPNLQEVLEQAKAAGVPEIKLTTNATMLNEKSIRLLMENGVTEIRASLDGATKATYERIRRGANFERVIGNLRKLQDVKRDLGVETPQLGVNCVMMHENINEWADVVRLSHDLGATAITFQPRVFFTELGDGPSLLDIAEQVNASLNEVRSLTSEFGMKFVGPEGFSLGEDGQVHPVREVITPHCEFPWRYLVVQPDGVARPCHPMYASRVFGSLANRSFHEIFYGAGFRALRRGFRRHEPLKLCRNCSQSGHDLNRTYTHEKRSVLRKPARRG